MRQNGSFSLSQYDYIQGMGDMLMPKLVRLYIVNAALGFGLSAAFLGAILALNLGGLADLILNSEMGLVAAAMMFVFNGIVFGAVQFGIVVMSLGSEDEPPRGGLRQHAALIPIPVAAPARGPVRRGARRG